MRLAVERRRDHAAVLRDISLLHPFDAGHELIRVGGEGDGGYLVPDDLSGIEACYSPGVGGSSAFELDLERRGIPSFLADGSVDSPPAGAGHLSFVRRFLGEVDDERSMTLDTWLSLRPAGAQGDLLLQMDIEGCEYGVILSTSRSVLRRFRIIVAELHRVDSLVHPLAGPLMAAAFRRLAQDFVPVHLHPNNSGRPLRIGPVTYPRLLEVTWLRRDRCRRMSPLVPGRHPLDRDNHSAKRGFELSGDWFAASRP